jgi:hypothetical protein
VVSSPLMKTLFFFFFPFALLSELTATESFVVHEWGTFTSVSASDGTLLPGLEREEEPVPPFVHSHSGFSPATKGWSRPVSNVTIKMETPVLYFYSDAPRAVKVDVKFHGGSISQWYPERSGGETMSRIVAAAGDSLLFSEMLEKTVPTMDFSKCYQGSASWKVEVLARETEEKFSTIKTWETPELIKMMPAVAHWRRARVAGANKVRGPGPIPEVEGFIFYRGIGNFALPLRIKSSDGNLLLGNTGAQPIPFLFVYEKRAAFPHGVVWWSGSLPASGRKTVPLLKSFGDIAAEPMLTNIFPQALERAGLTSEEARALVATWRESYFERDGLRVFWIVPRAFTDAVLPISITPRPEKLERALVGRTEVLTPSFEAQLKHDFTTDRGKAWMPDRYYEAYLARARQLGVVLGSAGP